MSETMAVLVSYGVASLTSYPLIHRQSFSNPINPSPSPSLLSTLYFPPILPPFPLSPTSTFPPLRILTPIPPDVFIIPFSFDNALILIFLSTSSSHYPSYQSFLSCGGCLYHKEINA